MHTLPAMPFAPTTCRDPPVRAGTHAVLARYWQLRSAGCRDPPVRGRAGGRAGTGFHLHGVVLPAEPHAEPLLALRAVAAHRREARVQLRTVEHARCLDDAALVREGGAARLRVAVPAALLRRALQPALRS